MLPESISSRAHGRRESSAGPSRSFDSRPPNAERNAHNNVDNPLNAHIEDNGHGGGGTSRIRNSSEPSRRHHRSRTRSHSHAIPPSSSTAPDVPLNTHSGAPYVVAPVVAPVVTPVVAPVVAPVVTPVVTPVVPPKDYSYIYAPNPSIPIPPSEFGTARPLRNAPFYDMPPSHPFGVPQPPPDVASYEVPPPRVFGTRQPRPNVVYYNMPPPRRYSYPRPPPNPEFYNEAPPYVAMSPPPPAHLESTNIVAAAAGMPLGWKYIKPSVDMRARAETRTFADYNPYRLRSNSRDETRHRPPFERQGILSSTLQPFYGIVPDDSYGTRPSAMPGYGYAYNVPERAPRRRLGSCFKSPFESGRPRLAEESNGAFFFLAVIISQIYFHVLLRLPSFYFLRTSRIFDETYMNIYEISEMAFEIAAPKEKLPVILPLEAPKIRPQYEELKNSWEAFIGTLVKEWETCNIISVLLLTAILTVLQISTAASDPIARYASLFSLICALLSLLFGSMYIIYFGTLRKIYVAVELAKYIITESRSDVWNIWVLLSMPVAWLAWSIIFFIIAIMTYIWRTTPDDIDPSTWILSATVVFVIRIAITCVLGLGLINTILIVNTFRHHGEILDKTWRDHFAAWRYAKDLETKQYPARPS